MLSDLIKQKQELSQQAQRQVPAGSMNAVSIMGVIRRAQIDLEQNRANYINESRESSVLVIVNGSEAESFANLSREEFGCFVVNAEDLYKEVASSVNDAYLGQGSSQTIINIMQAKLETLAYDIGVQAMPYMIQKQEDMIEIKTRKDIENLAKKMINEQIGVEVNSLYLARKASELAYDSDFKGKTLPIVVVTEDTNLATQLLNNSQRVISSSFLVTAGESNLESNLKLKEVDAKKVEKVLLAIKKNAK